MRVLQTLCKRTFAERKNVHCARSLRACCGTAMVDLESHLQARAFAQGNALVICGSSLNTDPCPSTERHFNEATVVTVCG